MKVGEQYIRTGQGHYSDSIFKEYKGRTVTIDTIDVDADSIYLKEEPGVYSIAYFKDNFSIPKKICGGELL